MPTLTPTQQRAYDSLTAFWRVYNVPRREALELFKELCGYSEIPYFMELDVVSAEEITFALRQYCDKHFTAVRPRYRTLEDLL